MKKSKLNSLTNYILLFGLLLLCQCRTHDILEEERLEEEQDLFFTKAAFDDYFDWDRTDRFIIYNPNLGREVSVDLPWARGSSSSYGIPTEWLDENAYHPSFNERYYSRENHWVLVYSNLLKNTPNKYFALYNTRTGLLRFFFHALSNASGGGTSHSYWGIKINKSSSLFNFTYPFAEGQDQKASAACYVASPSGVLIGNEFIGRGYQVNNWYGIEIECAYDPTIKEGSKHTFEMIGWAVNRTIITGEGVTTGSITGTIQYAAPNMNFNIGLTNMFNQTNTFKDIVGHNEGLIENFGGQVQDGINKNDSFFKGLWNNVKKKAGEGITDGVKAGLSTILSSGGSIVANALTGAASSILGIGGSKPSVGKVDLSLSSKSEFSFVAESTLPGWGGITPFPIPGSADNLYDMPLYNKPLGVWNLKKTPVVNIEGIAHDFYLFGGFYSGIFKFRYIVDCNITDLVINEEIRTKTTVQNFKVELASEMYNPFIFNSGYGGQLGNFEPEPFAYMDDKKYYSKMVGRIMHGSVCKTDYKSFGPLEKIRPVEANHGLFKVVISFDLVDNETGTVYSFARWFNMKFGRQIINCKSISISTASAYTEYLEYLKEKGMPPYYSHFQIMEERDVIIN